MDFILNGSMPRSAKAELSSLYELLNVSTKLDNFYTSILNNLYKSTKLLLQIKKELLECIYLNYFNYEYLIKVHNDYIIKINKYIEKIRYISYYNPNIYNRVKWYIYDENLLKKIKKSIYTKSKTPNSICSQCITFNCTKKGHLCNQIKLIEKDNEKEKVLFCHHGSSFIMVKDNIEVCIDCAVIKFKNKYYDELFMSEKIEGLTYYNSSVYMKVDVYEVNSIESKRYRDNYCNVLKILRKAYYKLKREDDNKKLKILLNIIENKDNIKKVNKIYEFFFNNFNFEDRVNNFLIYEKYIGKYVDYNINLLCSSKEFYQNILNSFNN